MNAPIRRKAPIRPSGPRRYKVKLNFSLSTAEEKRVSQQFRTEVFAMSLRKAVHEAETQLHVKLASMHGKDYEVGSVRGTARVVAGGGRIANRPAHSPLQDALMAAQ